MAERKSVKRVITEAVLTQLPPREDLTIDMVMSTWWMTGRQEGLRLSQIGDTYFRLAEVEWFEFPLQTQRLNMNWYSYLTELSQKIKCPYYIMSSSKNIGTNSAGIIRLYDSKIAMLLTLYGDLNSYLASLPDRAGKRK